MSNFRLILSDNEDVRESEIIRRKRENQIVVQLALIVGSFLFGYFPLASNYMYSMLKKFQKQI